MSPDDIHVFSLISEVTHTCGLPASMCSAEKTGGGFVGYGFMFRRPAGVAQVLRKGNVRDDDHLPPHAGQVRGA